MAGGSYKFSAKFKLLNQDSDKLWHQVEILIHEVYPSGRQTVHNHDLQIETPTTSCYVKHVILSE